MKKITCLIFMVILLLSSLFIFTGCDIYVGNMHIHIHEFKQHADDAYLKSKATCYLPTEYYYSCYCGQKSDKTFITQQTLGHNMPGGRAVCYRCNYVDFTRAYTVENGVITGLTDSAKQLPYLEIPQVIDGVAIAGIADSAFENNSSITRITIPDFIIKVGKNMFRGCNFLQSVDVKCAQVSENMFYGCGSLKKVYLGKNVTAIGNGAFYGCSNIDDLDLKNVTSIGESAFKGCTSLTSVKLIGKITTIPESAFENCTSLTGIDLPNTLTSIGNNAFKNSALTSISIPYYVTQLDETAFKGCTDLITVEIDGVSAIPSGAFSGSKAIKFLTLSESVKSIGDNAFGNCTEIEHLVIKSAEIELGQNALPSELTNLSELTAPYSIFTAYDTSMVKTLHLTSGQEIKFREFYNNQNLESIRLADSFTNIGDSAFLKCKALKSVVLGDGITVINRFVFSYCTNLTSVTFGANVNTIDTFAFDRCFNLQSITLPSSLKTIGNRAFSDCNSLSSITIPSSVTKIGVAPFESCDKLKSITFENPNGWYSVQTATDWHNQQNGTAINLSDPQANATTLIKTTYDFYLYKI
ncbi:MAG: leucine-rich repeat domain-containing protein [Clostridia bacterium]|nr:leucine-rich repeat domain-containing protein [Clostridia bacterium]